MKPEDGRLRKMQADDVKLVLRWRNTKQVRTAMFTEQFVALDDFLRWFESCSGKNHCLMIFELASIPVGFAALSPIDRANGTCRLDFFIGKNDLPRSTETLMLYLLLNFGFQELHLRKFTCEIPAFVPAKLKFLRNLGFVQEGCLKQHLYHGKNYEDLILLALFQDKWIQVSKNIRKELSAETKSYRTIAELQNGRSNIHHKRVE